MTLFVQPFAATRRLAKRAVSVLSVSGQERSAGGWSVIGPMRRYRGALSDFMRGRARGRASGWRCVLVNEQGPAGLLDFVGSEVDGGFVLRDRDAGETYARALDFVSERLESDRARFEVRVIDFPDIFVTALWVKGVRRSVFVPTRLPGRGRPAPTLLGLDDFREHVMSALRTRADAASVNPGPPATRSNRLGRRQTRMISTRRGGI